MNYPKWLLRAVLAAAAVLLFGLFSTELSDPDAWWHLKTGEYIVTQHRLPNPDPFAYTTAQARPAYSGEESVRRFNLTHEWLAQAAWYLLERGGGVGAVILWKALVLTALCGLTGLIAFWRTGSWLWGAAASLAAASLAVEFAHDRPGILSYLFVAAFIAILERRRFLWLLPVLALIWANSHGGFFLGWMVIAAYLAEDWLRRRPEMRQLAMIGAVTVLASAINPNGYAAIWTILRYRQSPLQSTLLEWSRADLWGPPYAFDLLLYGAALTMLLARRRVRPADWFLFAAFGAAALIAFRNEMLIGLLAPYLIAAYFPWKRPLPRGALVAIPAVLAIAVVWFDQKGLLFQVRAATWRYPEGAARFLRDHAIQGPLFNTYEYGGYLIWRGQRVFIDGRALSESVFADYRVLLGSPPEDPARPPILERYGIRAIVLNAFEYNSGVLYPLVRWLAASDWKLAYEDPQALVYLRELPPGVAALNPRRVTEHLEAECTLHVERDPAFSLCARTLGDYFMRAGDLERARRAMTLYMQHPYNGQADPEAQRAYLQLLQQ